MAGIKISALTAIGSPALSDVFPVVQGGVTYKETITQLSTLLFNSPVFSTPTLGAATATSLTFSPSTGGIVGTLTNDNAAAGDVGEYVSSFIQQASAVALTSTVSINITSISLTKGDWNVWGSAVFLPANTTTVAAAFGSIGATSGTTVATNIRGALPPFTGDGANTPAAVVPMQRFSLGSTTTIYLVGLSTFGTSTNAAFGFIAARRVR